MNADSRGREGPRRGPASWIDPRYPEAEPALRLADRFGTAIGRLGEGDQQGFIGGQIIEYRRQERRFGRRMAEILGAKAAYGQKPLEPRGILCKPG